MVYFIWDEYGVMTSTSSIQRVLKKKKWTKKKVSITLITQKLHFWFFKIY